MKFLAQLLLLIQWRSVASSSQTAADPNLIASGRFCSSADRFCGANGICLPRETKCTSEDKCDSSSCLPVAGNSGLYHFAVRWEPLPGVWGRLLSRLDVLLHRSVRSRRRVIRLQHLQLIFRGFAYEFGQDYPAVEVDPDDPQLLRNFVANEVVGVSRCRRDDVLAVLSWWNSAGLAYHLAAHNCQDFGALLAAHLRSNCQVTNDVHFARLYAAAKADDPCGPNSRSLSCLGHILKRLVTGRTAGLP